MSFLGGAGGKEPACQFRSHKRRFWVSNPLEEVMAMHSSTLSYLENPMDRGVLIHVTVLRIAKS